MFWKKWEPYFFQYTLNAFIVKYSLFCLIVTQTTFFLSFFTVENEPLNVFSPSHIQLDNFDHWITGIILSFQIKRKRVLPWKGSYLFLSSRLEWVHEAGGETIIWQPGGDENRSFQDGNLLHDYIIEWCIRSGQPINGHPTKQGW